MSALMVLTISSARNTTPSTTPMPWVTAFQVSSTALSLALPGFSFIRRTPFPALIIPYFCYHQCTRYAVCAAAERGFLVLLYGYARDILFPPENPGNPVAGDASKTSNIRKAGGPMFFLKAIYCRVYQMSFRLALPLLP